MTRWTSALNLAKPISGRPGIGTKINVKLGDDKDVSLQDKQLISQDFKLSMSRSSGCGR
ncbi:hypothetical protein CASFOL_013670 [Castilleja foliolosa]|uniref:Uncharacterized protein n=1 Tax=Castilleja foliolosa TaxID=1961234 RepID=A0ABD3DKM6_9LAMI